MLNQVSLLLHYGAHLVQSSQPLRINFWSPAKLDDRVTFCKLHWHCRNAVQLDRRVSPQGKTASEQSFLLRHFFQRIPTVGNSRNKIATSLGFQDRLAHRVFWVYR